MKLSEAIHKYAEFVEEIEDKNLPVHLLTLKFKNEDSEMETLLVMNSCDIEEGMKAEEYSIVLTEEKVSKL